MCNKEFEKNITRDGDGQASHEDPKDVIVTSNKEDTSTGIVVNSNARVYHKSGQSPKHAMWSLKVIGMSIRLKEGLLGVLDVGI